MHVKIAQEEVHFKSVLRALLERFQGDAGPLLLQKRGTLIIRGLCGLLGGIKVFTELASILEGEANSAFASSITQALNVLLLTAPELSGLRAQLQAAQRDADAAALLAALYPCWCHSACAALSLCMLAQAYAHIDAMIHALAELPLLPVLLAQIDRCAPCRPPSCCWRLACSVADMCERCGTAQHRPGSRRGPLRPLRLEQTPCARCAGS